MPVPVEVPLEGAALVRELSEQLMSGAYECAVCSEKIQLGQPLWFCRHCYGVLHLSCVRTWSLNQRKERERVRQANCNWTANKDSLEDTFRCPLCQLLNEESTTKQYTCYCGKMIDPKPDALLVMGSCGQTCERRREDAHCHHLCMLQCHPGSCPPCSRTRVQRCYCGAEEKVVGCSSKVYGFECGGVCGKELDCGAHTCKASCHEGPCPVCRLTFEVTCPCGASTRVVRCGEQKNFCCDKPCEKLRDCGNHTCGVQCHEGPCQPCLRTPERQKLCPCGKTRIKVERTSCLDPVPSCGLPCEAPLVCGHLCQRTCHDDSPCGPCKEMITQQCPCGNKKLRYPCFCTYLPQEEWEEAARAVGAPPESLPSSWPPKCAKPCRKPLSCNKHKCNKVCCTDSDHHCYQICSKKLTCGTHVCGQLCHAGPCPSCPHESYERLYCRCRKTWIDPPVPCGTKPPRCNHPCSIPRPCRHPPNHPCHIEPQCPPCVVLVEKNCASHNRPMTYHISCHVTAVSCGKPCNKPLTCCGSACKKVCHPGECKHECKNIYPSFADVMRK